jgi:hypothetical protein
MPVIQPGPFHGLFGDIEAQGLHKMQHAAGSGAGAGNVAAVLGNFRLHQYDIEHENHLKPFYARSVQIICQSFRKINPKIINFATFQYIH